MSDWKVGDKALCINNGDIHKYAGDNPPLRVGLEYVINAMDTCTCGLLAFDVGVGSKSNRQTRCGCGKLRPDPNIHWCASIRFVKKKTESEIREAIEKALDEEDYEMATELQKELYEHLETGR